MIERPVVNAHAVSVSPDTDAVAPSDCRPRLRRIGSSLGASMLDGTIYELDSGERLGPYRYEHGNERWILVLAGRPSLRHPDGEDVLDPGDVVCLPDGPDGAHALVNRGDPPARILMLTTTSEPSVSVYPDSGKIEVRPPGKVFLEASAVDLWDGAA